MEILFSIISIIYICAFIVLTIFAYNKKRKKDAKFIPLIPSILINFFANIFLMSSFFVTIVLYIHRALSSQIIYYYLMPIAIQTLFNMVCWYFVCGKRKSCTTKEFIVTSALSSMCPWCYVCFMYLAYIFV